MHSDIEDKQIYRVGELILDEYSYRLYSDDQEISLPKTSFDLFAVLVRRAPDVVTVDELMDLVWAGVVVAEETVAQRIKLIREALGEEYRNYVATVRGRGYCMTVQVQQLGIQDNQHGTAAERSHWARSYRIQLVRDQEPPLDVLPDSLAVLPFANMSDDPEQEYFSDGLTEDIITDLSLIPGLFVIARNSAFTYKGKSADVRRLGEEMGVRYVLEGSVRKSANQVRVTAQLTECAWGPLSMLCTQPSSTSI